MVIAIKKELSGCIHAASMFLQREQLTDRVLWKRFADQFCNGIDATNRGWRGEYWGKMMRGAVLVFEYSRDEELLSILTESVNDMLAVADHDGRVSSYAREGEFDGWDLWCRKYVMLGMEFYLNICCDEELKRRIIRYLCNQLDYIMDHIGEGKKCITSASRNWLGLNSSSILEPVVRLYNLTKKQQYLDFATYIVNCGGAEGVNIFELAFENRIYPYQYGVNKAYEMMSCFEGLLEYALAVGSEKYVTACIHFAKAIMESDVTIIGSCGCTHELLDHSSVRQTAYYPGVMQETCVTVTWMKLCARLLQLTGQRCFADAMEKSFYNAYLGSLNLHRNACDFVQQFFEKLDQAEGIKDTFLPFDSYSPLRAGKRGVMVGGLQRLKDGSYYGCCCAIGAAGVGVFAQNTVLERPDGFSVEFFEEGSQIVSCHEKTVKISMKTKYPADGAVQLLLNGADDLNVYIRIPGWCKSVTADRDYRIEDGYLVFKNETRICLNFSMQVEAVYPETWTEDVIWTNRKNAPAGWSSTGPQPVIHQPEDDDFVAFTRGPITLCADSRLGKAADSIFSPILPPKWEISADTDIATGDPCLVKCNLQSTDGSCIKLVDYASAGRDWKMTIAAWLQLK